MITAAQNNLIENQISICTNSLSAFRKSDPEMENLRANFKMNFFEGFNYKPMYLQLNFSQLAFNSAKNKNGYEVITMWGKQFEGFCDQIKACCEAIIERITECNPQESYTYVQNYISESNESNQNTKVGCKLDQYKGEIAGADQFSFVAQSNALGKSDKKFYIAAQKSTMVRKIIYHDYLQPLLDIYKNVYPYQIKGDIILFDFRPGTVVPAITNIREFVPKKLNEQLYYTCLKMQNCCARISNFNSYEFYTAMNSLYQQFLNYARQINILSLAEKAYHNFDSNQVENELTKLQNDIMSKGIDPNEIIDGYRFVALSLINIAILGQGTNTFENVELLNATVRPNACSKSKCQLIFYFKYFKENFQNQIVSAIKTNSHFMNGPDLSQRNFESEYCDIYAKCREFSVSKRNEYQQSLVDYNNKRAEAEDLFLGNNVASVNQEANKPKAEASKSETEASNSKAEVSKSEVEALKDQVNNKPFNISISEGKVNLKLGLFSANLNFGVFIHLRQKLAELKLITEKKNKLEALIQTLDKQDSLTFLYQEVMTIKANADSIGFEIHKSSESNDVRVCSIGVPRVS